MLTVTPVHPEGPRYRASIAYLSGLWVAPQIWLPTATFLAHRGWEGALVDVRSVRGGLVARAEAVVGYLRTLSAPTVLMGHDAGALLGLAVAARIEVGALVLVSPLLPGTPGTHAVTWSRALLWALLRHGNIGPPTGPVAETFFAELSPAVRLGMADEDARLLAHLTRRRPIDRPAELPPTLVIRGEHDPLLSRAEAQGFAADLGAEVEEIPRTGHWLIGPLGSQQCVRLVHPWLVQRLGEPLLELYAEAMAERQENEPDDG